MRQTGSLISLVLLAIMVACLSTCFTSCSRSENDGGGERALREKARNLVRIRDYDDALDVLEKTIELYPNSFEAHREYIKLLSRKGGDEAGKLYEAFLTNNMTNPLYHVCLSLIEEDVSIKEEHLENALELDGTYFWAILEKARLKLGGGDPRGAVTLLESIRGKKTGVTEETFLLADALNESGQTSEALGILQELARTCADEETGLHAQEEIFFLLWDSDREKAVQHAVDMRDTVGDPAVLADIAYEMSADSLYIINSIEFFERAISKCDSSNMRTYYPTAAALWLAGRSSKMKGFYGEGLGQALYRLSRYEDAVTALEAAKSELADPLSEVLFTLARAYTHLDRDEDAIGTLIELLSRQTDDEARVYLDSLYKENRGDLDGLSEEIEEARKSFWKEAPHFTLSDDNGEEFSLADLRGKVVLLAFWFPT